jgi:hypothetical protein
MTFGWTSGNGFLQHLHFADSPQSFEFPRAIQYRHAGGIVAAIFQASQAFDQDRDNIAMGDCADDSTHRKFL